MKLNPVLYAIIGIFCIIMIYELSTKDNIHIGYDDTNKEAEEHVVDQFYLIDNKVVVSSNMSDDQKCIADMMFGESPLRQSQWCTKTNVDDLKVVSELSKKWYKIDNSDFDMITTHNCNKDDGSLITNGSCDPVIKTVKSYSRIKHALNPHINETKK